MGRKALTKKQLGRLGIDAVLQVEDAAGDLVWVTELDMLWNADSGLITYTWEILNSEKTFTTLGLPAIFDVK